MNDQTSEKQSWWQRLSGGLKRTSSSIGGTVSDLVAKRRLDQTMLDEIEDLLIRVDLGVETAARIAVAVGEGRYDKSITTDEVKAVVAAEVEKVLTPVAKPLAIKEAKPFVALVIGVNGSGKTTTIGKIAAKLRAEGRSVMLAAGDTFRAAAIAPHAVLLVLDATIGQNALSQVEVFRDIAGVTGLVMTKLDGTARGGILVAIAAKYGLPVHFIGVGEGIGDLAPFSAKDFARALAGMD